VGREEAGSEFTEQVIASLGYSGTVVDKAEDLLSRKRPSVVTEPDLRLGDGDFDVHRAVGTVGVSRVLDEFPEPPSPISPGVFL